MAAAGPRKKAGMMESLSVMVQIRRVMVCGQFFQTPKAIVLPQICCLVQLHGFMLGSQVECEGDKGTVRRRSCLDQTLEGPGSASRPRWAP